MAVMYYCPYESDITKIEVTNIIHKTQNQHGNQVIIVVSDTDYFIEISNAPPSMPTTTCQIYWYRTPSFSLSRHWVPWESFESMVADGRSIVPCRGLVRDTKLPLFRQLSNFVRSFCKSVRNLHLWILFRQMSDSPQNEIKVRLI